MKTGICMIAATVFAALWAVATVVPTQKWMYPGDDTITQVVPDGAGGCAFVCEDTNDLARIVWVDKAGSLLYQNMITNAPDQPIVACTSKTLVYADKRPDPLFVQVDATGIEKLITAPDGIVERSFLAFLSTAAHTDAKGFVAVVYDIANDRQNIARFTYK